MTILDKLIGYGTIELVKIRDGKVVEYRLIRNLIVNKGLEGMAKTFLDLASGFKYIALGSSSTAPDTSQTALGGEIVRALGTVTTQTTSVTNDTAVVYHTFTFTSSYVFREAGLFNASSNGLMACRTTFSDVSVEDGDSLMIKWKIQFTRS